MVVESAGEKEVKRVAEKLTGKKFIKIRHPQIINPRTKRPLELDCYNEEKKLAFEYDGRHHYEDVKFWKTKLADVRYRDGVKDRECRRLGILLIRVPYTVEIEDIESFIEAILPQYMRISYVPGLDKNGSVIFEDPQELPPISINSSFIEYINNKSRTSQDDYTNLLIINKIFNYGYNNYIISGQAGCGKTSLAKSLSPRGYFVVRDIEDLYDIDLYDNIIIFENIDFSVIDLDIPRFLLSTGYMRMIHRDVSIVIPSRAMMIFTTRSIDGKVFGTSDQSMDLYKKCLNLVFDELESDITPGNPLLDFTDAERKAKSITNINSTKSHSSKDIEYKYNENILVINDDPSGFHYTRVDKNMRKSIDNIDDAKPGSRGSEDIHPLRESSERNSRRSSDRSSSAHESEKSSNISERNYRSRSSKSISSVKISLPPRSFSSGSEKKIRTNNLSMDMKMNHNDDISDVIEEDKHTILFGASGLGKTSLAKYILGFKCIVVENNEDLKKFDHKKHDGIIFENIDFKEKKDLLISVLTKTKDRYLICENKKMFVSEDTQIIFTTNIDNGLIFKEHLSKVYKRCKRIKITKPTYYLEDDEYSDDCYDIVEGNF